MEHQAIVVRFILEIMGTPKDFVVKKLREHIDQIKADGTDVQFEKYEEPVQKDKLFTQFVELQVSFKKVMDLLDFCFDNMPSSVEIIKPETMTLPMADVEDLLNDFAAKLHHADTMIKGMEAQKMLLDKNALNVFHNFIKYACSKEPLTIVELSKRVGLTEKALTSFVENLVNKGTLKKEGSTFITNG